MSAGKTTYAEKAVLNYWLRNTAPPTTPATVYAALFTTAPTDAYTSSVPTGVEVSGNAYARQPATFGAPSGTPSLCANTNDILFAVQTPGGYGAVVAVGIFDALTGGNLLYWMLVSSVTYAANDRAEFPIGTLTVSEE